MENKCGRNRLVDIHELIPNPKNNNEHDQSQIEWLAKIIDYQGIRKPIIVSNQTGFMITGHCTLDAIKYNGWDKAPVSFQDFENEAQEYAHMTADNEIARKAHFNASKAIEDIKLLNIDDIGLLGLSEDELVIKEIEIKEKELDEDINTDNQCPSCGYEW